MEKKTQNTRPQPHTEPHAGHAHVQKEGERGRHERKTSKIRVDAQRTAEIGAASPGGGVHVMADDRPGHT